jgi:hypothetical protein
VGAILRSAGAIIAALILATLSIIAVEYMSSILHPFPPGSDPTDLATCRAHVARYPAGVLLLASLGWGIGTLASSWLATRLGTRRHAAHGIAVGLVLLALAVVNMSMLPYPVWFWILNLILLPACFCFGAGLARKRLQ